LPSAARVLGAEVRINPNASISPKTVFMSPDPF